MLSVVIPTCNRPQSLQEAVSCVLHQSEPPDELIIVNNGSGPVELGPLHGQARVVDIMPFAGASQARNFGVLLASGDYVAFLDDDDLWELRYLEKVRRLIEEQCPDLIVTRLDRCRDGKVEPYRDVSRLPNLFERVLESNPGVGGPNTVVRRRSFIEVGGYDPQLITSEDRSLYIEFAKRGYSIVTTGEVGAIARDSTGARLTQPETMAEGKRRFLRKYRGIMSSSMVHRNLAIIHFQLFRGRGGPWRLLPTAWHLGLAMLLRRLG